MPSKWWEKFFKNHYWNIYQNKFTEKRNKKEVNFIYKTLNLSEKSTVLDLCGGHGRIAIPLAQKGVNVHVLDFNKDFLNSAQEKANEKDVNIETCKSDMREIPYSNKFDAVINIYASFGYFKSEKENLKVLKEVNRSLKLNGLFLIDVQNSKWIEKNHSPEMREQHDTKTIIKKSKLDLENKRNRVEIFIVDNKNKKTTKTLHETRLYSFNELKNKLENTGFKIVKKYGNFEKEKLNPGKSRRIITLARKVSNL